MNKTINLSRPTWAGFNILKRRAYKLTGAACYPNNELYYQETAAGHVYINLIYNFWWLKKEIEKYESNKNIKK